MQVDCNESVLSEPDGGGEACVWGGDVTLNGGAELPFGWQYRLSQGIYGAFGVYLTNSKLRLPLVRMFAVYFL